MINLIPPKHKQAISFARLNTNLISWLVGIGVALVGIAVVTGGSLFYLRQDSSNLKSSIDQSKSELSKQQEEKTLKQSEEMAGNIKLAIDVLSNEVLFSKLLQRMTEILPEGTVLRTLSLSSNIASSGIDLEIGAINYNAGSRAHVNLNDDDNGIFQRADLEGINCGSASEEDAPYECVVTIRALFAEDNPYMLISQEEN